MKKKMMGLMLFIAMFAALMAVGLVVKKETY